MRKINFVKITLDILMAAVFVLLFNHRILGGLEFHEIAGLIIGAAFIIHVILNFKWVKQVTLKLFSSKINFKTRLGYIIDALLLICFIIIIVTGMLISKVVLPNFRIDSSMNFQSIHISISYITLLLVGLHIGLHWTWVANVFKKIFGIKEKKKIFGYIARLAVVVLVIFGSYSMYSANYFSRVSSIATSFSSNEGQQQGSRPQGENGQRPQGATSEGQGGQQGNQHGNGAPQGRNVPTSPSVLGIILTYGSIISIFAIVTFYLDKLFVKRKVVNQV